MKTFSSLIKESIFSEDTLKKTKKNCCVETIFNTILLLKDFEIDENDNIEIKLEENIVNNVFEYALKRLNITYEKAQIVTEKKSNIFFYFHKVLPKAFFYEKKCCQSMVIKVFFLCIGYISNPEKTYHLEFLSHSKEKLDILKNLLLEIELDPKFYIKHPELHNPTHVLYVKKSDDITQFLGIIGANKQVLEIENTKIEKGFKTKINIQVNYENANIEKSVSSAFKYIRAIEWAMDNGVFNELTDDLKDIALLRLNHPEENLRELCNLYNNKLTKSGINHRLRKLYGIIQKEQKGRNKNI